MFLEVVALDVFIIVDVLVRMPIRLFYLGMVKLLDSSLQVVLLKVNGKQTL